MRKKYSAILLAVAMACIMAIPAAAEEIIPDSDVQAIDEVEDETQADTEQVPTYEDTESEDQGVLPSEEEVAAEEPSQDEIIDEDDSDDELSDEDTEYTEEDLIDEYAIATLAVTNGFGQGEDGNWYYYTNGQIDTSVNSVIKGTVNGVNAWWYVVGGQVQMSFTGLANYSNANGWWYIENGKVSFTYNGVEKNKNGWFYIKDSKVDFSYNGFASNSNGNWYIENGKVTFNKNSVIKDSSGAIGAKGTWWYVVGSKAQTDFTGLANYSNSNGWWYIEKGKVSFTYNGVEKNKNGWWYIKDSKVDFSYNGFASNSNGNWYIENGKVTFNKNSVIKDSSGAIGAKGTWWYVVGSKVQTSFTGLANYSNSNGWWYIENGKVSFTYNGVEKNKNGWWYIKNSKVDFSYNGFASNSNGKWYIDNGKVTFNKNSVIKDSSGAIGTKGTWWYVVGSKVQTDFTGLANYSNSNGWWYIKDGKVDFTKNTVAKNKNGWWYVLGGKVQFDFTGLADYSNSNGWWYINNGKVTFNYTGIAKNKNGWYYCKDSKVLFDEPLALAAKFVGAHSSANASNSDKLSSVFSYMRANYNYTRYYGVPTAADLPSYAVDYFTSMTGNCYRHAAACTCVAKVLGYETRTAVGTIDTGNGPTAHGWCEVKVNGTWYILDVGFNVYMKTMEQYPDTLAVDNRYTLNVVNGKAVWQ